MYDAANLDLTNAREGGVIDQLPIPSLETVFEVTVSGRVHKVPAPNSKRGSCGGARSGRDHEDSSSINPRPFGNSVSY